MFHLNGQTGDMNTADDIRAAGLNEEFADKLDRTGHPYSASALRNGLQDMENGMLDADGMLSNLNAAHTLDHKTGEPTEGDPAFYGAAGAAWTGGQAPKDLAEVIGETLRSVLGDDVDGISVMETGEPLLSVNEVKVLQTALMFISAAYASKEGGLTGALGHTMMQSSSAMLRALFGEMGAKNPMDAVIDIMKPMEEKLNDLRTGMLDGKTSGAFVAPF